jgi:hypothetical protein
MAFGNAGSFKLLSHRFLSAKDATDLPKVSKAAARSRVTSGDLRVADVGGESRIAPTEPRAAAGAYQSCPG